MIFNINSTRGHTGSLLVLSNSALFVPGHSRSKATRPIANYFVPNNIASLRPLCQFGVADQSSLSARSFFYISIVLFQTVDGIGLPIISQLNL